jgi:hypothetical protein
MEQEVPVTIHGSKPKEPQEGAWVEASIPGQVAEISEVLAGALSCFRESGSWHTIQQGTEKAREYIKKNPARAMLLTLGAGALVGFLMKKKR